MALRDIDEDHTIFDVTEVFCHFSRNHEKLMDSDLPLLRLPYKACFFEGPFPPDFKYVMGVESDAGWSGMPPGGKFKRMGVVAFEQEMGVYAWELLNPPEQKELKRKGIGKVGWTKLTQEVGAILLNVMGVFHIQYKHPKIDLIFLNGGAQMLVNPMGQLIDVQGEPHTRFEDDGHIPMGMGMEWLATFVPKSRDEMPLYTKAIEDQRTCLVYPSLVAIGMLNCKNVEEVTVSPSEQVQKARKRKKKKPLISYKTLRLQLPGRQKHTIPLREALSEKPVKGEMRYHRRRGHFKTFTEMRPLFGKFTGTYWWSPAMRGNPKRGRVIKGYEVELEESNEK